MRKENFKISTKHKDPNALTKSWEALPSVWEISDDFTEQFCHQNVRLCE